MLGNVKWPERENCTNRAISRQISAISGGGNGRMIDANFTVNVMMASTENSLKKVMPLVIYVDVSFIAALQTNN